MAEPRGSVSSFFSFEFSPSMATVQIAFEDWAKEIDNWEVPLRDVAKLFRSHEKRQFATEGNQTGPRWAALSNKGKKGGYDGWKARRYPGQPILQRSGVLHGALTRKGAPGSLEKVGKNSLVVGINPRARVTSKEPYRKGKKTRLPVYAKANDQGATVWALGRGHVLPSRPLIRFRPSFVDRSSFAYAISQILQAYIVMQRKLANVDDLLSEEGLKVGKSAYGLYHRTVRAMIRKGWK
jgi:phage gpG-like protein